MNAAPNHSQPGPRNLSILWRDDSWTPTPILSIAPSAPASSEWKLTRLYPAGLRSNARPSASGPGLKRGKRPFGFPFHHSKFTIHYSKRAFTVLEMLVVITIIGFMAALALPHLTGMTRANSMSAALQQLLGDCALGRQLAMTRRSTVYMVFVPPNFATNNNNTPPANELISYTNLLSHQYGAYALISLRSVGDQPGQANAQYLTEWKALPDGVFIAPFKFTNQTGISINVSSTNTLTGSNNVFSVFPFPYASFPFPAIDALTNSSPPATYLMPLPYIAFNPLGQLANTGYADEYIPLARGRVLYPVGATGPVSVTVMEAPPGNDTNNCNIIHLDWQTARAKIERNQQR